MEHSTSVVPVRDKVRLLGESPFALQCLPSAILAIGTFFLPYSPRWLMNKGMRN